jgi:hypothetical protein
VVTGAINHRCGTAWTKMQKYDLITPAFIPLYPLNGFRQDLSQYCNEIGITLTYPPDDVPDEVRVLTNREPFFHALLSRLDEEVQHEFRGFLSTEPHNHKVFLWVLNTHNPKTVKGIYKHDMDK